MAFWGSIDRQGATGTSAPSTAAGETLVSEDGQFSITRTGTASATNELNIRGGVGKCAPGVYVGWLGRFIEIPDVSAPTEIPVAQQIWVGYTRWGERLFERMNGEFAVVIWDGSRGALLLARDPLGAMPLYYGQLNAGDVKFGDHAGDLGRRLGVMHELDRSCIISRIIGLPTEPGATCLTRVKSVPAGSFAVFCDAKLSVNRYWRPKSTYDKDIPDLVMAFRRCLWDGVRRLTPGNNHAVVALSGGLDSSSVVRIANLVAAHRVQAVSYRLPGDEASDELEFARAAVAGIAVPLTIHEKSEYFDLETLIKAAVEPDAIERFGPTGTAARWAKQHGSDVLLTGGFGDVIGGHDGGWQAHYASSGRWLDLLRDASFSKSHWASLRNVARVASATMAACYPSLGDIIRFVLRAEELLRVRLSIISPSQMDRRQLRTEAVEQLKTWLDPDFSQSIAIQRFVEHSTAGAWRAAYSVEAVTGLPLMDPFADKELFCIAASIPWELRHGPDGNRILLRKCMQGVLPDKVRLRRSKCHYSNLYGRLFRQMLSDPTIGAGGRHIEYILCDSWSKVAAYAISAPYPILEATYRAGLIGAWLRYYGSVS